MAVIRTPNGLVDDTGSPLPMAKQDVPNVGNAIIAGAPAATLTPQPAAAQPPALPGTLPAGSPVVANTPTPSPQATSARPPTQRGPTSGVSTPVDDALIRAKADSEVRAANDQLSPTTMVLNYLTKMGKPRTSENVRLALEANARDPSLIQGLVNQAPPAPTAIDTAPNVGRGGGGGGGRGSPVTPTPPAGNTPSPGTTSAAPGATIAAPVDKRDNTGGGGGFLSRLLGPAQYGGLINKDMTPDAATIAGLALAGGAGLGAYGAGRYMNRNVPPPPTTATPAAAAEQALITPAPERRLALPAPETTATPTSPMDSALNRATSPTASPEAPRIDIPQVITADDVRAAIRAGNVKLPPGVSEEDFARVINNSGAPQVNFAGPRNAATSAEARLLAEAEAARNAGRTARSVLHGFRRGQ